MLWRNSRYHAISGLQITCNGKWYRNFFMLHFWLILLGKLTKFFKAPKKHFLIKVTYFLTKCNFFSQILLLARGAFVLQRIFLQKYFLIFLRKWGHEIGQLTKFLLKSQNFSRNTTISNKGWYQDFHNNWHYVLSN